MIKLVAFRQDCRRFATAVAVHSPGPKGHEGASLASANTRRYYQHGFNWIQYFQNNQCLKYYLFFFVCHNKELSFKSKGLHFIFTV
jgi:hypothetical protein